MKSKKKKKKLILTDTFLRHFIEYALLKWSGGTPLSMGPGVKPCGRKWFYGISNG